MREIDGIAPIKFRYNMVYKIAACSLIFVFTMTNLVYGFEKSDLSLLRPPREANIERIHAEFGRTADGRPFQENNVAPEWGNIILQRAVVFCVDMVVLAARLLLRFAFLRSQKAVKGKLAKEGSSEDAVPTEEAALKKPTVAEELARLLYEAFKKTSERKGRRAPERFPIYLLTGDVLNPIRNALDRSGFFRMYLGAAGEAALGDFAAGDALDTGLGIIASTWNVGSAPADSRVPHDKALAIIHISGAPALKLRGFWRRTFGSSDAKHAMWHMNTDEDARWPDYETDTQRIRAGGSEIIEVGRWRWYAWFSGPLLLSYLLQMRYPEFSSILPAGIIRLTSLFAPTPAQQLRRAIELAVTERRQVFLKIPFDVASQETIPSRLTLIKPPRIFSPYLLRLLDWIGDTMKSLLENAIDLLWDCAERVSDFVYSCPKRARSIVKDMVKSKKPVMFVGSRLERNDELKRLVFEFSKKTGVPIANSWAAQGFDGRFENSLGTYTGMTTSWEKTRSYIEDEADFILRLGDPRVPLMHETGVDTAFPRNMNARRRRRYVGRRYFRAGEDLLVLLKSMIDEAERQGLHKEFNRKALNLPDIPTADEVRGLWNKKVTRASLLRMIEWSADEIENAAKEVGVEMPIEGLKWLREEVRLEVGPSKFWFLSPRFLRPVSSDFRRADIGTAPARAASAANRDSGKFVICITGDGGFAAYGWQVIQDMAKLDKKPRVVMIVIDDNSYSLGSEYEELTPGGQKRLIAIRGKEIDYADIAEKFGVEACRVETNGAFIEALNKAQRNDGPTLIVIPMKHDKKDYRELIEFKRLATSLMNATNKEGGLGGEEEGEAAGTEHEMEDAANRSGFSSLGIDKGISEKKETGYDIRRYEALENFVHEHSIPYKKFADGTEYGPTPFNLLTYIFDELERVCGPLNEKRYLSFGAGDLRDALYASCMLGMEVTAAETNGKMYRNACGIFEEAKERGFASGAAFTLQNGDALDLDWSKFDAAFFFYTEPDDLRKSEIFRKRIRKKIGEMKPGSVMAMLFVPQQIARRKHKFPDLSTRWDAPLEISNHNRGYFLQIYRAHGGYSSADPDGDFRFAGGVKYYTEKGEPPVMTLQENGTPLRPLRAISRGKVEERLMWDAAMPLKINPEDIKGSHFNASIGKDILSAYSETVNEWWRTLRRLFPEATFGNIVPNGTGSIRITCTKEYIDSFLTSAAYTEEIGRGNVAVANLDTAGQLIGPLNIAFAASNIPDFGNKEWTVDYGAFLNFINEQYYSLAGKYLLTRNDTLSFVNGDKDKIMGVIKKVRNIFIELPTVQKIDHEEKIEEDMVIEALRAV